jgi:flagellar hook-length control protein FliK
LIGNLTMMLNEMTAISNSNGTLSGTGRLQALKDGPFAGMCPFTDDPEPLQKDFLSILSRLGSGTVQAMPEESSNADSKLAEGRLPEEVKADDALSEKPKGKQGKDDCAAKRLPVVCPDSLGIVMGLLSRPDPPQSTLSADPALHAPGSENGEEIGSGSTVGEVLPEMMATLGLTVNRSLLANNTSIPPVIEESGPVSAVQAKIASKMQVKEKAGIVTVAKAGLSDTGRVPAVPVEESAKNPGQWPEPSTAQEPVPSGAEQVQAFPVEGLAKKPEQRAEPSISESVSSQAGQAQTVSVEGMPKIHRLQKRDSLAIPDTANLNPVAGKNDSGVKGYLTKKLSSEKSMDAVVREDAPIDQKNDTGVRHQAVKGKYASFLSAIDSVETGAIAAASAGASNAEENETPNMLMAANQSGKIAGGEGDASFNPPAPESGDMAVHSAREGQMEKTSLANLSPKESLPEGQSFHAEVLKQIVEKTSTNMKSGQSEIRIDLKPESLGHLRLLVSSDRQQVTVKILAENAQVKEMIENQASLIKNELQQQGIHVNTVKVDMLMSGGSDFAYSQHEGAAFKQARHEPGYGGGKDNIGDSAPREPDSLDHTGNNGGSLVNYFA